MDRLWEVLLYVYCMCIFHGTVVSSPPAPVETVSVSRLYTVIDPYLSYFTLLYD